MSTASRIFAFFTAPVFGRTAQQLCGISATVETRNAGLQATVQAQNIGLQSTVETRNAGLQAIVSIC